MDLWMEVVKKELKGVKMMLSPPARLQGNRVAARVHHDPAAPGAGEYGKCCWHKVPCPGYYIRGSLGALRNN